MWVYSFKEAVQVWSSDAYQLLWLIGSNPLRVPRLRTINSLNHFKMLEHIVEKTGIIWQHDKGRSHTSQLTCNSLKTGLGGLPSFRVQSWICLVWFSPVGTTQTRLTWKKVSQKRGSQGKGAKVTSRDLPKEFFAYRIRGLEKRLDKCRNIGGDYVEKRPKFFKNPMNHFWALAICLFTYCPTLVDYKQ